MRIGFLGKGGSGKTTIAAAFVRYMAQKRFVLAIDADVNVNLGSSLNMEGDVPDLGESFENLSKHVLGERVDVDLKSIVATTPPSTKSRFLLPLKEDPFIEKHALHKDNLSLIRVGTYLSKDIGHTCYHGKLNALELFYHHLLDGENDIVVADATAGIDNIGTSLYFAYDLNIFVVEPTLKSVNVFKEFYELAKEKSLTCYVIANKLRSQTDIDFLHKHIDPSIILAEISESKSLALFEQGDADSFGEFVEENSELLAKIEEKISQHGKDWKEYYNKLILAHKQNSEEWWDDYYDKNISEQYDPEFSYEKMLEVIGRR